MSAYDKVDMPTYNLIRNPVKKKLKPNFRVSPLILVTLIIAFLLGRFQMMLIAIISILIHEIAHAIIAKMCGFNITSIELLPIGAVATIEGLFEKSPIAETIIALAGPLMSLLLSYIFNILSNIYNNELLYLISTINLSIGIFNLIPAMPLDGGRVIRAALAPVFGLKRATIFCCWLGIYLGIGLSTCAIVFAIKGIIQPMLIPFGIFIILASNKERQRACFISIAEITDKKETLVKVGALPIRQIAVPLDTKLYVLVSRFRPRAYHMIIVIDDNMTPIASINEGAIIDAMMKFGSYTRVGEII